LPYKDPEKRREYQREYQRRRRAGEVKPSRKTSNPDPVQIEKARDILSLLEEVINEVRDTDTDVVVKARCIGYLAGIALRAVEISDLEGRIEALETTLKLRKEDISDKVKVFGENL